MKKVNFDFYTYNDKRKCRYSKCLAPIADQEHATRQYCPREELPDGSVKNCKDDYWAELKKEANTVYKEMELFHKLMEERLSHLYNLNLPEITIEIIESTGIELPKSLMHFSKDETCFFYFINYVVTYNLIDKRIKITKHEIELF
jgi:hypothetical protein